MSDNYLKALEKLNKKILIFLSIKPRSTYEVLVRLKSYLSKLNIKLTSTEKEKLLLEITKNLKESRYLNDKRFSIEYVTQQIESPKPVSTLSIKKFLIKKGISSSNISNALNLYSFETELENTKKAAEKKLVSLKKPYTYETKNKVKKYLLNKGFSYNAVNHAIDSLFDVK